MEECTFPVSIQSSVRLICPMRLRKKEGEWDAGTVFRLEDTLRTTSQDRKVRRCVEIMGGTNSGTTYECILHPMNEGLSMDAALNEIQIMHHLFEHPNIVRMKGGYLQNDIVYIVTELCAGGDLFDRIVEKGHYSENKAAQLMKIIVEVVEFCNSLGVIHRDLKPENIMFTSVDEDASLKVTGFSFSTFYKTGETFSTKIGSFFYMAPEVVNADHGPEVDVWSAGVILYILLSGVPPFWGETDEEIFKQVLEGELDFESDMPEISDSAKDLIRKMLERDPKKRITAYEVLCHPWIVDDNMAPHKPLDSAVLSRLKKFSTMNKLKKMALLVIGEKLSDDEIIGLKELFKMIDTDSNQTITSDELKNGLNSVGSELSKLEIKTLMDAADIDGSGTIDYTEFIAATLHLRKLRKKENLMAAFSCFDKDGSGYISRDEFLQACADFGQSADNVDQIIKDIDQDNNGQIDYKEFAAMMRKDNTGTWKRSLI